MGANRLGITGRGHAPNQLQTVDAGQRQIQKGELGFFRLNLVQRVIGTCGEYRVVTVLGQDARRAIFAGMRASSRSGGRFLH